MTGVNKNNINGFSISFVLHAAAALALFYMSEINRDVLKEHGPQETISISLSSFEVPKETIAKKETPKPIEAPKPVEPKEVKKIVVKNESPKAVEHVQKNTKPKIEPKMQPQVQEVLAPKVVEAKKTQVPMQAKPKEIVPNLPEREAKASLQDLEAEFVKTNFNSLREKVLSNLKYPHLAKRMKQSGMVELLLVIDTKGKLIDISVHRSSGYKLLDKSAAQAASKLCAQSLPVPQTISKVMLPIYFALN